MSEPTVTELIDAVAYIAQRRPRWRMTTTILRHAAVVLPHDEIFVVRLDGPGRALIAAECLEGGDGLCARGWRLCVVPCTKVNYVEVYLCKDDNREKMTLIYGVTPTDRGDMARAIILASAEAERMEEDFDG